MLFAAALPVTAAQAQTGNPIKVGISLALTGAGAPAGKMILAAIEIWRDDVNAKGGLLGRPVELIVYDDQSKPSNVPGIYTKLITVDKVDLLLGPYATNFVAPAMPTIMQNNKMTISFTAIGINGTVQLQQVLLDGAGRAGRRERVLQGLLRDRRGAEPEAADSRDRRRRRRVRADRRRRRPRGAQEARLQASSTTRAIRRHDGLRAGRARYPGGKSRHRLYRRLSARHGRHRPRRERDRPHAEDVRRRDDRAAGDADQDAARTDRQRHRHRRELRGRRRSSISRASTS